MKNCGIFHKSIKLGKMVELDPDNNFRSGPTSNLTFGDLWALISGLKCTILDMFPLAFTQIGCVGYQMKALLLRNTMQLK